MVASEPFPIALIMMKPSCLSRPRASTLARSEEYRAAEPFGADAARFSAGGVGPRKPGRRREGGGGEQGGEDRVDRFGHGNSHGFAGGEGSGDEDRRDRREIAGDNQHDGDSRHKTVDNRSGRTDAAGGVIA